MQNDLYGRKPHNYGRVQKNQSLTDILDQDTALIFALIFLLKKESRDPMLMLALLYILT